MSYACSSRRRVFPSPGKVSIKSLILKKGRGKKVGVKGAPTFTLTVVTGSEVQAAWSTRLARMHAPVRLQGLLLLLPSKLSLPRSGLILQ